MAPAQKSRVIPKRLAATKAQGSYVVDHDITKDDAGSDVLVQPAHKSPAKRKRRTRSRTTALPADPQRVDQDDSDYHDVAQTTTKKSKPPTSSTTKRLIVENQTTSTETDATMLAEGVFDDDKNDEDFSPVARRSRAKAAEMQRKQYSLRGQREVGLVTAHVKKRLQRSRRTEELGPENDVTTTSVETVVEEESYTLSTQGSLRGKQVAKQRKITESKASVHAPNSPKPQATKKKIVRIPGDFTNEYKIRFGFTPFRHNTRPSRKQCHTVFEILKKHHERDNVKLERYSNDKDGLSQNPMHAGDQVTFHAIVKTILSQATNNDNAQTVEQSLIHSFRYDFLGCKVKGSSPNYHLIRKTSQPVFAKALASGGLHNIKAKLIKGCLDYVYDFNMARATDEERLKAEQMENGESADFVPGMLSLDYLLDMGPQEKFDHLVGMPGIGPKTAACILCFNFEHPVFAVDTHVQRLSRMLRWLPLNASNFHHSFMHLDKRVPDELKYGLHQAFWHHGQDCLRCRAGSDRNTKGWNETVCPIEHLVDRSLKDPVKTKKPKANDDETVERPKKIKSRPTVYPHSKLTPEEAAELGYELRTIVIDDGFGVRRANFMGRTLLKWVLKSDHDALEQTDRGATAQDIEDEVEVEDPNGIDDAQEIEDEVEVEDPNGLADA